MVRSVSGTGEMLQYPTSLKVTLAEADRQARYAEHLEAVARNDEGIKEIREHLATQALGVNVAELSRRASAGEVSPEEALKVAELVN